MKHSILESMLVRHANARHPPIMLFAFVVALFLAILATPAGAEIERWWHKVERVVGGTQLVAIPELKEYQT